MKNTHTPAPTLAPTKTPAPTPTVSATPVPTASAVPVEDWIIERLDVSDTGNYRDAMRWWVIDIANKAREVDEDFIIIPQNCTGLFPELGDTDMNLSNLFINTISGVGNESTVFGMNGYGVRNEEYQVYYNTTSLLPAKKMEKPILSIDYCKSENDVQKSIQINNQQEYLNFQAKQVELKSIPETIQNENANDITCLNDASNFLILLNPAKYRTRTSYINALAATNYDVIIIDCYFNDGFPLTAQEVATLKTKANGGKRLVISYLSIGEAEDYRPYWDKSYYKNPPEWILKENPNWRGNYPVYYWNDEWQDIIAFGENSYLSIIQNAGFDGVYLDIVDGYMHFE